MQITRPATEREQIAAAKDVAYARDMIAALEDFAAERQRNPRYTRKAEWALFNACNAWIGLVDDGDTMAQRDVLMFELGCDEYGYPADAPLSFDPARVHPDDPCQSKGVVA